MTRMLGVRTPTLYSYIVRHDSGFAPNPFYGFCTLACCKPNIRRTAQEGDYVVGLGPKGSHVVYAMRVTRVVGLNDYWEQFPVKRPDVKANGVKAVGDNIYRIKAKVKVDGDDIYHRDNVDNWSQERSQHSKYDKGADIGGRNALISRDFVYWGGKGEPLPSNLKGIVGGRGHRSTANKRFIAPFIKWFEAQEKGRLGEPTILDAIERSCSPRRKRC